MRIICSLKQKWAAVISSENSAFSASHLVSVDTYATVQNKFLFIHDYCKSVFANTWALHDSQRIALASYFRVIAEASNLLPFSGHVQLIVYLIGCDEEPSLKRLLGDVAGKTEYRILVPTIDTCLHRKQEITSVRGSTKVSWSEKVWWRLAFWIDVVLKIVVTNTNVLVLAFIRPLAR